MPRLTIGVPVYNSEALLEQSLKNLAAQTFTDFKVIVLDNASTDRTGAIAKAFASKDSRFEYRAQTSNVGAKRNFSDVLGMADTPYFMWRADDDTSEPNFIEVLVGLLDANPDAALAACRSELHKPKHRRIKSFPQRRRLEPAFVYRIRLLRRARASWIYGIFRTAELTRSLARVYARYPHLNGFDFLVLFPFLWTNRVVGSNATSFVTGFVDRPGSPRRTGLMDPRPMARNRRDFLDYCWGILPELESRSVVRFAMAPFVWLYADRSYRIVKIANARVRMLLGETPTGSEKSYD